MSTLPYVVLVQADFTGTTFGASPTWTDITADCLPTGIGSPITVTDWRQDRWSTVSPSVGTLVVDNAAGTYTPGTNGVTVGVRIRVTVTIDGVSTALIDGLSGEWVESYVSGVPVVSTTFTNAQARFGTLQPLRSIYAEEVTLDSPAAFYPLDEAVEATTAGDITGKNIPGVIVSSKYGGGTFDFGVQVPDGFLGTAQVLSLSSPDSGSAARAERATTLRLPKTAVGAGQFTLEMWTWTPSAAPAAAVALATSYWHSNLAYGSNTDSFDLFIDSAGFVETNILGSAGLVGVVGVTDICDGKLHHVAITLSSNGKTIKLYIDGVQDATAAVGSDIVFDGCRADIYLGLGVQFGEVFGPYTGLVGPFATFPTDIGAARVLAHYNAGVTAFAGESTNAHVARLLTYRPNYGSSLDTGIGTVGVHDTVGSTLAQALIDTGKAEDGLVYVNGSGLVTLLARSRLQNPTVAYTLDASAAEVTMDTQFRIDDQDIVNDATISRPRGADQRVYDSTSINSFGTRDGSDTRIVNSDAAALDIASNIVANGKAPAVRTPNVTVNVATLSSLTTAKAVVALKPFDRLVVSNLPATAPTVDVIVEGRTISLGVAEFDVTFFTSPLRLPVLVWDDATYGKWDTYVWGY